MYVGTIIIIVVMIIYINIERKKLKIQEQYARKKNRKFFGRSEKCSKSN